MASYWFAYKVSGGRAIAEGPFKSRDEAMRAREMAKAPDIDVSPWFVSDTSDDAQKRAEWYLS